MIDAIVINLWILVSVAEVAHDRTLEKLWHPDAYKRHLNEIRKNYKMVMLFATAVGFSLLHTGGLIFFAWEASSFWFIHELGLSIARDRTNTFGVVGTSHWVDTSLTWIANTLKMSTTLRLWFNRAVFTAPVLVTSYLLWELT